jgi:hypothetical protein
MPSRDQRPVAFAGPAVISVGKASPRSDYPACLVPQNLWMLIAPLFAASSAPNKSKATRNEQAAQGSFRWLCEMYFESSEFKQLDDRTKRVRRNIIDGLCREHGNKPVRLMEVRHVRYIRDARADHFEAANAILKALRQSSFTKLDCLSARPTVCGRPERPNWRRAELANMKSWQSPAISRLQRKYRDTLARRGRRFSLRGRWRALHETKQPTKVSHSTRPFKRVGQI